MANSIDSNTLLTQLRTMAAQAGLQKPEVRQLGTEGKTEFTEILKSTVEQVNEQKKDTTELVKAFERGDQGVELSQVMIEMQKARISFETLSQVRNKVITAYQDIMNMPL